MHISIGSHIIEKFTKFTTTLIPKKMKTISCFNCICLISLCNIDYKIFSFVLINRLKDIFDGVISLTRTDIILNEDCMNMSSYMYYQKPDKSSKYILFNGSVSNINIPIRHRSRQDDPISDDLFNIALNVLNSLIVHSLWTFIIMLMVILFTPPCTVMIL
eukprot:TRINITY_DN1095_c0_g1_i2.p1 TRINITY_DN1095_c0_g1~~TRINITY_DN1095_c0_g1_i2.p1  ORF type:complete len:160 (+),score=1.99 TRINITY_DN1095_c0_g1_i2:641-1120(+)